MTESILRKLCDTNPLFYLWEAYQEGLQDPVARRFQAGEACFGEARAVLADTWRTWSPYHKMALTLAALDSVPSLLENRAFDVDHLLRDLPNCTPEQRTLEQRGFLRPVAQLPGGYAPQAEIVLWFLAEELTRLLRPTDPDLAAWLRAQEWGGLLKQGEWNKLNEAIKGLGPLLKEGVSAFIKSTAEGLGKGLIGR